MDTVQATKILGSVFGEAHQTTKELKGIPIVLRTLYDSEVNDALRRSLAHPSIEYQIHDIKRWKLAYSLISVNETEFPSDAEECYKLITGDPKDPENKGWPNYFVEQVFTLFNEVCDEEDELVQELKKPSGTDEETPNS